MFKLPSNTPKGVIASFHHINDARHCFNTAPNQDCPRWHGDLRLLKVLAVKR